MWITPGSLARNVGFRLLGIFIDLIVSVLVAWCGGYLAFSYTNNYVLAVLAGLTLVVVERRVFAWRLKQEVLS